MHYARKNSPGENGYRQFGPNRARTKPVFSILYFHFQTRLKYKKWSNQSLPEHPIHIQCHIFNAFWWWYTYYKLMSFRDYLALDQHDRGCIWRNLTFISSIWNEWNIEYEFPNQCQNNVIKMFHSRSLLILSEFKIFIDFKWILDLY